MNNELREFNNIFGIIEHLYHQAALKIGMTDSEFDMFYVIAMFGDGCNQSMLYKETGMRKSTVNTSIRKLEKEGALYLKSGDGRNTKVYLTEKGQKYLGKVENIIEIENKIFQSWSKEERNLYMELNQRYARQFEEEISGLEMIK